MIFKKGDEVENLRCPNWGPGVFQENLGNGKVRVWFTHGGDKNLVLDKAKLVPLGSAKIQSSTQIPADPIILKSKRSRRLEREVCHECRKWKPVLWHYSKSNRGPVNICSECKGEVVTRSHGPSDAMNLAESSGQFESNRRRH